MTAASRQRDYAVYDVFTAVGLKGNPVAVVVDSSGLLDDEEAKLNFARWTNLSETVFLYPPTHPEADYKVEIFTPLYRLPFAGHPTLGSAYAWLAAGGTPKREGFVTQECDIGLVQIKSTPATESGSKDFRLAFAAPPFIKEGEVDPALPDRICSTLKLDPKTDVLGARVIDNGPGWIGVHVKDASIVLNQVPPAAGIDFGNLGGALVGIVGEYKYSEPAAAREQRPMFELRAFVSGTSHFEDPVTGSLNAGVAQWLISAGKAPAEGYLASQGFHRSRQGLVYIQTDEQALATQAESGTIWVGGDAVRVVEGRCGSEQGVHGATFAANIIVRSVLGAEG
ncbi:unnamed protein product [Tilletia controversa]|uniref:Uncharacterized protein n=3 Tax=Tilletia TaxID=13289 RepID=A0A8X7SWB5_9BASI|nr:hypothetical protein CF336_g1773 [Tilletia laevis]KAE8204248.1 hypothetical protein CF328_g1187 [Tilletia controversa]CAD6890236.1 unnamed protein product [Tilletia caries]KAE8207449.1 hypothetical protein CF335_g1133 [Tilletia laevis]KAE8245847.1 hypothetical protein A4X06_0g5378 [Tilletia controversa]